MSLKRLLLHNATTQEVAREIYEQIIVCDDLGCALSMETILSLCKLATPTQVQIAVHDIKFA